MHFTKQQRDDWSALTKNSPFNRWLRDNVSHADGTLDLDRLHALAEQYGIDGRGRYGHLNPGQQRMNVGNRLRSLVPQHVYAKHPGKTQPAGDQTVGDAAPARMAPELERPLEAVPTAELMSRYAQILEELRHRAVIRTRNSPVGDYAEFLFAKSFGLGPPRQLDKRLRRDRRGRNPISGEMPEACPVRKRQPRAERLQGSARRKIRLPGCPSFRREIRRRASRPDSACSGAQPGRLRETRQRVAIHPG